MDELLDLLREKEDYEKVKYYARKSPKIENSISHIIKRLDKKIKKVARNVI